MKALHCLFDLHHSNRERHDVGLAGFDTAHQVELTPMYVCSSTNMCSDESRRHLPPLVRFKSNFQHLFYTQFLLFSALGHML